MARLEVSEPTDGKEVSCKVGTKEEEEEEEDSSSLRLDGTRELRLDGTREASATCFIWYSNAKRIVRKRVTCVYNTVVYTHTCTYQIIHSPGMLVAVGAGATVGEMPILYVVEGAILIASSQHHSRLHFVATIRRPHRSHYSTACC